MDNEPKDVVLPEHMALDILAEWVAALDGYAQENLGEPGCIVAEVHLQDGSVRTLSVMLDETDQGGSVEEISDSYLLN